MPTVPDAPHEIEIAANHRNGPEWETDRRTQQVIVNAQTEKSSDDNDHRHPSIDAQVYSKVTLKPIFSWPHRILPLQRVLSEACFFYLLLITIDHV